MRAIIVPLLALVAGCAPTGSCTLVLGFTGVSVQIDPGLAREMHRLILDVCTDSGCTKVHVLILDATPDGSRRSTAQMEALPAGTVLVSGTYRRRGRLTRLDEVEVRTTTSYPNGRRCRGEGTSAQVRLTRDGLRAA